MSNHFWYHLFCVCNTHSPARIMTNRSVISKLRVAPLGKTIAELFHNSILKFSIPKT